MALLLGSIFMLLLSLTLTAASEAGTSFSPSMGKETVVQRGHPRALPIEEPDLDLVKSINSSW